MDTENKKNTKPKKSGKIKNLPLSLELHFARSRVRLRSADLEHFDEIYGFPGANNRGIAGIIPVIGSEMPTSAKLPFPPHYLPITSNCLAVQRSVLECARMKCSSIWIVCTRDQVSTLQNVIGNGVVEEAPYLWRMRWVSGKRTSLGGEYIPPAPIIPIYYAVVPNKQGWGRDASLPKTILWGAHSIYCSAKFMSKYFTPSRFYVTFPFSVFPYYDVPTIHLVNMKTENKGWLFTYEGKSVKDGLYLPFIFTHRQFIRLREMYKRMSSGSIYNQKSFSAEELREWKKLSMKERYAEKEITLSMLLEHYFVSKKRQTPTEWYYDIHTWEGYRDFLGSNRQPRGITYSPSDLFVLAPFDEMDLGGITHPYENLDLSGLYEDTDLWKIEDDLLGDENNEADK